MRKSLLLRIILLSLILGFKMYYSPAQISRIAILSESDTTFVHDHVGLTIFQNFTDTLNPGIAIEQQIVHGLKKYLSINYKVDIMKHLPDSVLSPEKSVFSILGLRKEVKNWMTDNKDKYDFLIIITNTEIPHETNLLITKNTSGIYSRNKHVMLYTTLSFIVYRTSNLQQIEYYHLGGQIARLPKNFRLPEDKKTFIPEQMAVVKDNFIKLLDSNVEYFLAKTYLVPQDKIDKIKVADIKN